MDKVEVFGIENACGYFEKCYGGKVKFIEHQAVAGVGRFVHDSGLVLTEIMEMFGQSVRTLDLKPAFATAPEPKGRGRNTVVRKEEPKSLFGRHPR